ncbi:MAG: cysteine desulfurase [Lachnospiraceae bacterium]|nr:cysteine desulfurase [Lachnospiraceae bacterium]
MEIYLDNAATTPCSTSVAALMQELYTEEYGNPSSAHKRGFRAEQRLKEAAERIAKTLKCKPKELIFTSGGTESDNLALRGIAHAKQREGKRILVSAVEHAAVAQTARALEEEGFDVIFLPVDKEGVLDLEALREALTEDVILVSVMAVNNETGSIQPLKEIGALLREKAPKAVFHTDAVQGYGKIPMDLKACGIDAMSVSAHKLHGPKGTGFLYLREGIRILPLLTGGAQQEGMRPGTIDVPGICGMALAAEEAYAVQEKEVARLYEIRQSFCESVTSSLEDVIINGPAFVPGAETQRVAPHIIALTVRGVRSEVLMHALEEKDIYVSAGSACSTHRAKPSATLTALGLTPEDMSSTVRLSLSFHTTEEEMKETARALTELVPRLRKYQAG